MLLRIPRVIFSSLTLTRFVRLFSTLVTCTALASPIVLSPLIIMLRIVRTRSPVLSIRRCLTLRRLSRFMACARMRLMFSSVLCLCLSLRFSLSTPLVSPHCYTLRWLLIRFRLTWWLLSRACVVRLRIL